MSDLFDNHFVPLDAKPQTVIARADAVPSRQRAAQRLGAAYPGQSPSRSMMPATLDLILSGNLPSCSAASASKVTLAMILL